MGSSGIPGLIPGSNVSGSSLSLPYAPQQGGQAALGGTVNPLLPINTSTTTSFPMLPQGAVSNSATTGLPAPTATNTGGFPANGAIPGTGTPGATGGTTSSALGLGSLSPQQQQSLTRNLDKTYGAGIGGLIMQFLQGGAGYNQTAINNLIAQLQPQFKRSQQDLMQQFSASGNRFGSGAQIGMGDLLSQQNLEVGSLETQMYEQAISNYMNILMGAGGTTAHRIDTTQSFWDQVVQMVTGNVDKMNKVAAAAAAGG